jgi:hypothetical protein
MVRGHPHPSFHSRYIQTFWLLFASSSALIGDLYQADNTSLISTIPLPSHTEPSDVSLLSALMPEPAWKFGGHYSGRFTDTITILSAVVEAKADGWTLRTVLRGIRQQFATDSLFHVLDTGGSSARRLTNPTKVTFVQLTMCFSSRWIE